MRGTVVTGMARQTVRSPSLSRIRRVLTPLMRRSVGAVTSAGGAAPPP